MIPTPPPPPNYVAICACGAPIRRREVRAWERARARPGLVASGEVPPPMPAPACAACRDADPATAAWQAAQLDRKFAQGQRWPLVADVLGAARSVVRFDSRQPGASVAYFEDALRSLRVRVGILAEYDRATHQDKPPPGTKPTNAAGPDEG